MTEVEKELIAQQAELMGLPETARTLRTYLSPQATTRADLIRAHTLASAFGWRRVPGWRLAVDCGLLRWTSRHRRLNVRS